MQENMNEHLEDVTENAVAALGDIGDLKDYTDIAKKGLDNVIPSESVSSTVIWVIAFCLGLSFLIWMKIEGKK